MFDIRSVQIPFTLPSLAGRKVCSRALQRGLQCFAERHHDRAEALYYKRRRASHTSAKKLAEEVERFALLRRMKTVRAVEVTPANLVAPLRPLRQLHRLAAAFLLRGERIQCVLFAIADENGVGMRQGDQLRHVALRVDSRKHELGSEPARAVLSDHDVEVATPARADARLDALVEGRDVMTMHAAHRQTERAEAVGVHFRNGFKEVDAATVVVQANLGLDDAVCEQRAMK